MAETTGSGLSQADIEAWNQQKSEYIEKLRAAIPENTRKQIDNVTQKAGTALMEYMLRPDSDPEVLELFGDLVSEMARALEIGKMDHPLTTKRTEDVKAGLIGAARVLNPAVQEGYSPIAPVGHVRLARRFIELTENNVGTINRQTGEAEIRQRFSSQQAAPTVKHTPK